MPAPSFLLRTGAALLATTTVALGCTAAPAAPASAAHADRAGAHPAGMRHVRSAVPPKHPPDSDTPLTMTLDVLDRVSFNEKGPFVLRGTVTNRTDETYDEVDVYPFVGNAPITDPSELADQTALSDTAFVGERIVLEGDYDTVSDLEPGETTSWSLRIPKKHVMAKLDGPGVYWFGAHSIITGNSNADGRTRTFLPYLPPRLYDRPTPPLGTKPQPTPAEARRISMVLPLRRRVVREADGRVAHLHQWSAELAAGGRLDRLLDVGRSPVHVTWLLDPAVLDAVRQLAAGNPPRDMGPTAVPDADESPSPSESGSPSDSPSDSASDEASPAMAARADSLTKTTQRAAKSWLAALPEALSGNDVLALPYGDPDLAALSSHAPDLYATARQHGRAVMRALDIHASPAVAPPTGYLSPTALKMLSDDPLVLVSDRTIPGANPPVLRIAGRKVISTTSAAATGPGPGNRAAAVPLRQQAASLAALRRPRRPVVVMLPDNWVPPTNGAGLLEPFAGERWVDLVGLSGIDNGNPPKRMPARRLHYTYGETEREISGRLMDRFKKLIATGRILDRILPRNDTVSGEITEEALTSMSYAARGSEGLAASSAQRYLESLFDRIRVQPPRGVILSSDIGDFSATVVNGLDQPVELTLQAAAAFGMDISTAQETVSVPANSSSTVLLTARAQTHGVHHVTLQVTDGAHHVVGASGRLPIRTGQSSTVIWWFVGAGSSLMVLAIVLRLVRRVRNRGRDTDDDSPEDSPENSPEGTAADAADDADPEGTTA